MIEKLIKKTARILDHQKIPYMIIGGQAVLIYGRPRLTRDIDITLGIDTDRYIEKWLLEFGKIAGHEDISARFDSLLKK